MGEWDKVFESIKRLIQIQWQFKLLCWQIENLEGNLETVKERIGKYESELSVELDNLLKEIAVKVGVKDE